MAKQANSISDAGISPAFKNFDSHPDSAQVDVRTVAAVFGCSVATVWRHARVGLLPKPDRFGGLVRWKVGALRQVLSQS